MNKQKIFRLMMIGFGLAIPIYYLSLYANVLGGGQSILLFFMGFVFVRSLEFWQKELEE